MTMYWFELFVLSSTIILCDYWFFIHMKKHRLYNWFINLSLLPGFLFILVFLYIRFGFKYNHDYHISSGLQWAFYFFALIYIPKITYILFYHFNKVHDKVRNTHTHSLRRTGFVIAIFMVGVMGYGNMVTRDDLELVRQQIDVKELPAEFDGYKIAVIADFHIGNWNNRYRIMHSLIDSINSEYPDMIIFAGDMVNNFADELEGWEPYFKELKSKQGNFAVLGNHDYGDYTQWKSDSAKSENLERIKQGIRNLGFRLLLNENENIVMGKDTISLVGVENWSNRHFHCYGDLRKALINTPPSRKKILITHDPAHWDAEVVGKNDIFLSISGHTHAGQMGVINKHIRFSPSMFVFKQWQGLYKKREQYLYVNRGIGYVGIPMRIGVRPEITILELKRTSAP